MCFFLVLAGNSFWCFVHMVLIVQYCCAVVSVFGSGGKSVLDLHTYVLNVQYNCGVVLVFWSWRQIVIDFMYVFSVQYSCGVVSVFWLWRVIVLKMRTCFYKKILLGYFIMIRQLMCVFIRPNTLFLCIFLFCMFLLYCTDNEFVLVSVQIDLIHLEHSICISSTSIETNTNPLVQLELKLIQIRYIQSRYI